jgi:Big-like domain-containing protein/PKD domain-containing protein
MTMLSRIICFACAALLVLVAIACDTIPLTAPSGSAVTISVANNIVPLGGTTEVTAFVSEQGGTAVQNGTTVRFTTNLGRMEPIEAQTKNGYAVTTFVAGDVSGVADVTASSGSIGGGTPSTGGGNGATTTASGGNSVKITVGAAASETVVLNASPTSVPVGGGTVTLIASVLDINGNRLRNVPVNFSTDAGTLSSTIANTDANGEARVELNTNREANVTARAAAKSTTLKIIIQAPATVALSANPSTVPPSGGTVTLTAVVLDASGNRLANVPVSFSTTAGTLSATQATTNANGEATVELVTNGATTVTARAGTVSGTAQITPGGAISLTVNPTTGQIGANFNFTVTPASGAQNVSIDFGDGSSQDLGAITSTSTVGHRYATPGTYVARATQTNIGGAASSAVVTVTVTQ